jgi:ribose 5-phosphate isomerase B
MGEKVYIATDHAGFLLKEKLVLFVRDVLHYDVVDCGAYTYDSEDDFTDFIVKAAREVSAAGGKAKGIILGGSGQGEAMLANRFHNVRAVVYYGGASEILTLSRTHNDANVLSLGARFLDVEEAKKAVMLWLNTPHVPVPKYDRRIEETEEMSATQKVPTRISTTESKKTLTIAPSLPASSFGQIETLLNGLTGTASSVQIDIVDGVFAPATSWPFTAYDVSSELLKLSAFANDFEVEIDCMCMHPETYLDVFLQIPVSRVIIHVGSTQNTADCTHGYKIGLGILNTTKLEAYEHHVADIDFIQVMGIATIGSQGQPFDERTIDTIARLHKKYPSLEIAVDGAVNASTIVRLKNAGATRFAPGSAVARAQEPASAYTQLLKLLS